MLIMQTLPADFQQKTNCQYGLLTGHRAQTTRLVVFSVPSPSAVSRASVLGSIRLEYL